MVKDCSDLPENVVVIYIHGGIVRWTARGPGRLVDVLIIDHDDEAEEKFSTHWEYPKATVEFDNEISRAIEGAYAETK